MSFNYAGFVSALSNLAGTNSAQPNFQTELPSAIDYAEQRIFRDLDLITTVTEDNSQTCTPSSRYLNVPGAFVVVNSCSIITPAGVVAANGRRNQLCRTSKSVLDLIYPDSSFLDVPLYYEIMTQGFGVSSGICILGPWPDQAYGAVFTGTQRPAPLSSGNPNTFLSTSLPDLMLIAAMIHMAAYQKNWSSIGNDPGSGTTYEQQYQKLLVGADAEELRKRYAGTTVLPPAGESKQPASPDAKP
jgi:hypothetical protein